MKIWVLSWEENGWHFTDTSGSTQSLCTHDGSKTKWSDASRRKDVPVNKLPNADSCVIVYFATRRSTTKVNFQRCQTFSQLQNWGEKNSHKQQQQKKICLQLWNSVTHKTVWGKKTNSKSLLIKITFLGCSFSDGISEIQNASGWHTLCHHTGRLKCLWKSATWHLGTLHKTI